MNASTNADDSRASKIEQAAKNVSVEEGPAPNPTAVVRDMAHDIEVAAEAEGGLCRAVLVVVSDSMYVAEEDKLAMVCDMASVVGA